MAYRPITPALLADELAELAYGLRPDERTTRNERAAPDRRAAPDGRATAKERGASGTAADGTVVLAVDGAPAAAPGELADAVAEALSARGRAVLRVSADDFLRPASVRLERGRENPDSYYEDWLDEAALRRELLDPLAAGGPVLPRLWNPVTDRSWRAERVRLGTPGVLVLDGPLLLGRGLRLDLVAHLAMSPAALARRTPAATAWMLPAFARYADEVSPDLVADVVVRYDHPAHPAVRTSAAAAG